jgi:hypothetical protein
VTRELRHWRRGAAPFPAGAPERRGGAGSREAERPASPTSA